MEATAQEKQEQPPRAYVHRNLFPALFLPHLVCLTPDSKHKNSPFSLHPTHFSLLFDSVYKSYVTVNFIY